MEFRKYLIGSIIGFVLSVGIAGGVSWYRLDFDTLVKKSRQSTHGYDKQFIALVDKLEHELEKRAQFGYTGGRDPMTGRSRRVVRPVQVRQKPAAVAVKDTEKGPAPDPVRLTAILFDDRSKKYTALVMDGERSVSIEVGDEIRDRRVRSITSKEIVMEDSEYQYRYDINGKKARRARRGGMLLDEFDSFLGNR